MAGAANLNAFQYTGRENEGNGLYFYRARYYSPLLGRFVNEDPLGFEGSGPNFYAYVFDNPTNLTDPFGLSTMTAPTPTSTPPTFVITVEELEGPSAFALFIYEAKLSSELIQTVSAINAENAAYGAEWQSVIAYNQAVLAHPRPLAGRYTLDEQRDWEHQRYKDLCSGTIPAGADECSNLSREIDRAKKCIAMMQDFDRRWNLPGRHKDAIQQWVNGLENLKGQHNQDCTSQ